ncbi:ParA family protein [Fusobacterium sp. THCT1E2]
MAKRISIYNYKEKIGKTTSAYYMAKALSEEGKRVLMIDADPQCSLTKLSLDLNNDRLKETVVDLHKAVLKAFEGQPIPITAVPPQMVSDTLFLTPGSNEILKLEATLSFAHKKDNNMKIFGNIAGAFNEFFNKMEEEYNLDYIIIDFPSTMKEISKNLLMVSDYIAIPTIIDLFMNDTFILLIKEFHDLNELRNNMLSKYSDSYYSFPDKQPKFIGFIKQDYLFDKKIENKNVKEISMFTRNIKIIGMLLENGKLGANDYILSQIPNLTKSKELFNIFIKEMAERIISLE